MSAGGRQDFKSANVEVNFALSEVKNAKLAVLLKVMNDPDKVFAEGTRSVGKVQDKGGSVDARRAYLQKRRR